MSSLIAISVIVSSLSAAWVAWLKYKIHQLSAPELAEVREKIRQLEARLEQHHPKRGEEP